MNKGHYRNRICHQNPPAPSMIVVIIIIFFQDAGYVYYSGCYDISPEWVSEGRTNLPQITDTSIRTRSSTVHSCVRAGESIVSRLSSRQRKTTPRATNEAL